MTNTNFALYIMTLECFHGQGLK